MYRFTSRLAPWLAFLVPALAGGAAAPDGAPPELARLVAGLLDTHPEAEAARARLEVSAAALRGAARAVYNPELELDTEDIADVRTSYVQLSQTIDLGDRRGARTQAAEAALAAARARMQRRLQELARDALVALGEHAGRAELARLAERRLELMRDFARVAERRARAGDLGPAELNLARLALNEAVVRAAEARSAAMEARENLRTLFDPLPDPLPPLPRALPEARLPADLDDFVLTLPVMRAARAAAEAARARVALRRAEKAWDPTIAVRTGSEGDESLAGLTFTLPLNVRNPFTAEVEAAEAEFLAAEKSAQQRYRLTRAELVSVSGRYRLTRQAWLDWERTGRTSIQRQLALLERLWKSGDMSTADYLVQVQQTLDTQAAGIELRERLWRNWADWLLATGRIFTWLHITQTGSK